MQGIRRELLFFFIISDESRGGGHGGPAPLPLFLDQTEARKAENFWGGRPPPSLSKGVDDRPPPLSQDLDPALIISTNILEATICI